MLAEELYSRLKKLPLFATLSLEDMKSLLGQARVVDAPAGQLVLQEGDHGEQMFVIAKGAMQVFSTAFDATDVVLARLERGTWFGEQALLPGGTRRRNASVRSVEDSRLISISFEALEKALKRDHELLLRLRSAGEEQRVLRSSKLREEAFEALHVDASGSSYSPRSFRAGEVIFRQGDAGDHVYLILHGRARVKQTANGQDTVLAELMPGMFFGELAILTDSPRKATVEAATDLETVSLDGGWFRSAVKANPALHSLMDTLSSMYMLPRRGLLTLQTGSVEGRPCETAIHSLTDGRRVVSTRLTGSSAFTSRLVGTLKDVDLCVFEDKARGVYREIGVAEGKLVSIHSEGEWTGLGDMLGLLLDGTALTDFQLTLFRQKGDFRTLEIQPNYENREVLCACTQATCGAVQSAIGAGCHTLAAVAAKTGATKVCGGCVPLVKELLGQSDWSAARVAEVVNLSSDVRAFRIKTAAGTCEPHKPGQHVVVQARIDNRWVQRPYTLTNADASAGFYEITVKREPQGVFSRWLFDRMPADALLRVSSPAGDYYLPDDAASDVVCLVGGIGVTPAISFARRLAKEPRAIRLHMDYSASEQSQFVCAEELGALARSNDKISVRMRVTRQDGRFCEADARALETRFPGALYYVCGGTAYQDAVVAHLRAAGVPDERVRVEVFTVAGEKPKGPLAAPRERPAVLAVEAGASSPAEQAKAVLQQCYAEANASAAFEARWKQVEREIESTGTYFQTLEELQFCTRVAWRNSTRCVGRLYWEGLTLRDFRHARTSEEMIDAIMGHIEIATNGGALKPVITVFPQAKPDGTTPRVWSPQLFRYAGYDRPDGTVLGDPANRELTRVAMELGWQPPATRTPFDMLPIIAQAAGDQVAFRDIPKNLVLEIPLIHPDFPWFAELGLKWYALPAVSGMRLDGGGVDYRAIPFNGWYMGPEIGARNFGDVNRYDMLPVMAKKMGLDTSSDRTLWRDRALIELNVAVLYSYDQAGVTMMDHHAASKSFEKFEDIETAAGRPVHAKWNWIVPPISGSAVGIFHKDHWQDIELKPNYTYQPDAWLTDPRFKKA